jgi:hypothetical protein
MENPTNLSGFGMVKNRAQIVSKKITIQKPDHPVFERSLVDFSIFTVFLAEVMIHFTFIVIKGLKPVILKASWFFLG